MKYIKLTEEQKQANKEEANNKIYQIMLEYILSGGQPNADSKNN